MTFTKNLAHLPLPSTDRELNEVFVPVVLEALPWLAPRRGAIFAAAQRAAALDRKQRLHGRSSLMQLYFSLYCIAPDSVGRFGSIGYHVVRRKVSRHGTGWRFDIQTVMHGRGFLSGYGYARTREEARRQLQLMAREIKSRASGSSEKPQ